MYVVKCVYIYIYIPAANKNRGRNQRLVIRSPGKFDEPTDMGIRHSSGSG